MLRKRSRAVTSKQAKVGDQNNNLQWLPYEKQTKPISYFFNSPRIFKGFLTIGSTSPSPPPPPPPPSPPPPPPPLSSSSEVETTTMSPTSILDGKHFSNPTNSLRFDTKISNPLNKNMRQNKHSWDQLTNKKGIGLALVDENIDQQYQHQINNSCLKQKRKLVVFGSQLKIQVPPLPSSSVLPCFSPESPREFGIKTPRSLLRPFGGKDSHQVHAVGDCEVGKETESISVSEMEDSEDYTCVISHGPNPKTTHIFGNCVVGSCCGIDRSSSLSSRRNGCEFSAPSEVSFLSFCHHCKKKLGHGKDIFMYRGEKAFCSKECRCQEMLCDDGVES